MGIQKTNKLISKWLKDKLNNHENGVILENNNMLAFEAVQDFIESIDCTFKTPVIYFEAFPEESLASFFATLYEELASKLSHLKNDQQQSLVEVIQSTSLKMVIIDKSHLQPIDTFNSMIDFFARCNVVVIIISTEEKTKISGLVDHEHIVQWEKLSLVEKFLPLPKLS